MTRSVLFLVASVILVAGAAPRAQQPAVSPLTQLAPASPAQSSPAERRIAQARTAIARDDKRAQSWNELALALARRARETADPAYYQEAWTATERSLQLEPGNLEGRKLQAWILLGQHEFARAVDLAERINREMPDEVLVYGFLVDG